MNKWMIFLAFCFLIVITAGCSSNPPTTTSPTIPQPVTIEPTETTKPLVETSYNFISVSITEVQNIIWLWQSVVDISTNEQSIITDPQKYTLILVDDGSFFAQADCNNLQGTYQSVEGQLQLTLGITTLAECGPGSFFDQYIQDLQNVVAFGTQGNNLVLQLGDSTEIMTFSNGGVFAAEPEPSCDAGIKPDTIQINTQSLPDPTQTVCVIETPYNTSQPPGPSGLPDHIEILFSNENPEEVENTEPNLYIIPVESYTNLWQTAGNQAVAQELEKLIKLLLEKPQPVPVPIPILPFERVAGTSDIQVQPAYLNTLKGNGIRIVTRFSQGPNPVTSDNPPLFYVFQGLSFDGDYLISFFYPVTTSALPTSAEVSQEERNQSETDPAAYLQKKTEQLNTLQSTDFVPDLATLDQVIQSLNWTTEPATSELPPIANINWQWAGLNQAQTITQTIILDPYNYTVTFAPEGNLGVRADCNNAFGNYSLNGPLLTIQLGPVTLAACPEGSRSDQFLSLLPQVEEYAVQGGQLILNLQNDTGSMIFTNGGQSIVVPPPPAGVPTAITSVAVNIRSGPGTQYSSYGIAPAGVQAEVVGKSADSGWWAIRLPAGYAPDNLGWVSADYVQTNNTETVPILPSSPQPD